MAIRRNTYREDELLEEPFDIKQLIRAFDYIKRHMSKMVSALILSAVAGIIAGAIADIGYLLCFQGTIIDGGLICDTGVYEIVPAFIIGLIVSVIVTLATKAPSEEVLKIYEMGVDKNNDQ